MNKFLVFTLLFSVSLFSIQGQVQAQAPQNSKSEAFPDVPYPAPPPMPKGFNGSNLTEDQEKAIKYALTIRKKDLEKHLAVLASDEYEGRETGQKGQKMAAEYMAKFFEMCGVPHPSSMENYFQTIPLKVSTWADPTIKVKKSKYEFLKDFYAYGRRMEELSLVEKSISFVGYGIEEPNYDDYNKLNVKGKTLLMFAGEPKTKEGRYLISNSEKATKWSKKYSTKLKLAFEKEAELVLVITKDIEGKVKKYDHYINGSTMDLTDAPRDKTLPNTVFISYEMANQLLLKSTGKTAEQIQAEIAANSKPAPTKTIKTKLKLNFPKSNKKIEGENVLAFIEGSDLKDEVIVLTAHYDHLGVEGDKVFNGADDDGTGTVALMEIAQAFQIAKRSGHGPRRSILIMPVAAEEKGLLGSRYYTDISPVFPLEKTYCNLNIDMIGRQDKFHDDFNYLYIIGADKISQDLHDVNEQANEKYVQLELDYTYNDEDDPNRYYYRSDHYNFAKNGVPVIFYFNGTHDDYHKHTDTIDKINFDAVTKRTKLVFHTAWMLANRTGELNR